MLPKLPEVKYSLTRFGGGQTPTGQAYPGGLDLTTPSLSLQPGALRAAQNFECSQSGGYGLIAGYERVDGRAAPSAAAYTIVQFTAFGLTPSVGDTLTQAVSGATGKVITPVGSNYVALTQVSGTFDTTHNVTDGGVTVGIPVTQTASISAKQQAQYLAAAADVYRALIGAVPGSGKIIDVFGFVYGGADVVFALRANAGNTAVAIYKTSVSGWTLVPFYNVVEFTAGGTATAVDGDVLTQGGVTATVKRVMWRSGAWTGSAVGGLVITNPAGGNFAAGAATCVGSGATVTLTAVQTAITMLPGGTGEHTKCNFSGQPQTRRVYGCDGVNKAYEFDGDVLAPITTGTSPDTPSHITNHKNYLVITRGGSVVGSGPGLPFKWGAASGAWEIATGDTVTGMITLPGSQSTATMAVFQRANTSFLYGLSVTDFNFVTFNTGMGAKPGSIQNLFDVFVFDDLGVVTLQTTLNWGNFLPSTLTRNILPFIIQERAKLTCSTVNRSKSQYRVFFSDGYGLYLTIVNRQYLGATPVLFPNPVACIDEADISTGGKVLYFGSSDGLGYIYQQDVGTSCDGATLSFFATSAWDAIKSPRIRKRFRAASLEVQGTAYAEFSFGYSYSYGSSAVGQPSAVTLSSGFAPSPMWDAFTWDSFTWDGQTLAPSDADMGGTAENVQITISGNNNYTAPFNLNSAIFHYTPRRGIRP